MKAAGERGESESMARETANNTKPGKATVRMPQRSIMRPRIGVASALVNAAKRERERNGGAPPLHVRRDRLEKDAGGEQEDGAVAHG